MILDLKIEQYKRFGVALGGFLLLSVALNVWLAYSASKLEKKEAVRDFNLQMLQQKSDRLDAQLVQYDDSLRSVLKLIAATEMNLPKRKIDEEAIRKTYDNMADSTVIRIFSDRYNGGKLLRIVRFDTDFER